MRCTSSLLIILVPCIAGALHAAEPRAPTQLIGAWKVTAAVEGDRDDPFSGELRGATVIVTDKALVIVSRDGDVMKGPYTVSPQEKEPHFIDFEWKRQKVQGIFRIKDSDLTLCFDRTGKDRPTGFQVGGDRPGCALVKLERLSTDPEAALPKQERNWARDLVADFLSTVLAGKTLVAQKFFAADYRKTVPLYNPVQDPSVKVRVRTWARDGDLAEASEVWRKVRIPAVFEQYEVLSETISPDRTEFVFKGSFRGKITKLDEEGRGDREYRGYAANWIEDEVTVGELGERTGTFVIRVAKEQSGERWAITFFRWDIDPLPKK